MLSEKYQFHWSVPYNNTFLPPTRKHPPTTMQVKIAALFVVVLLMFTLVSLSEGAYRKPPFNGSIFGKRGSSTEYDTTGKALSAMCEISNEACQSWFPSQENK